MGVDGRRSSTRTPILLTIFPPSHVTGLEQLGTTDKHSCHHGTPLAHAFAHSRSDGDQAQPEGLETIPSRLAQGWHLPREARGRLERSVEACTGQVSRLAVCHMPGSGLAATLWDQTSRGGFKHGKVRQRWVLLVGTPKNRCSQSSFGTVGVGGPNLP